MSEPTREEALAHFGVKGMKWGQRKADPGKSRAATRRDRRIEGFKTSNEAIASGTAKRQKQKQIATLLNATPKELLQNKGSARQIAAGRAAAATIMQQHLESGTANRRERKGMLKVGGMSRRVNKYGQLV